MTATKMIWEAAGAPLLGDEIGRCRVCGAEGIAGVRWKKWVKSTFTDMDKVGSGDIVCSACLFCFSEASVELARRVGKEKPQKMRNYSHFVVDGRWIPLSKAAKEEMANILLGQPWEVAVIAKSGQKHIIFRASVGVIQFEEQQVHAARDFLARLLYVIGALYQGGFSKAEIGSGRYNFARIERFGPDRWMELESELRPHRGGAAFDLALFLVQKEVDYGKWLRSPGINRRGG